MPDHGGKSAVRARVLAARAALSPAALTAAARALSTHVLAAPWRTLAAYVPVGSEPGSVQLLDALRDRGVTVLLPVVVAREPLDWAVYDGSLVAGPGWLREPAGVRLGPTALGTADAVLVPALAVDEWGTRLGRGAGLYDRSLGYARTGVPLVGLLHDGELLAERLPAEPHDIGLTAAIRPGAGWVELPVRR